MNKTKALASATDEDKLLIRHVLDLAEQSRCSGRSRSSCFLDERQQVVVSAALKHSGYKEFEFAGGYDNSIRKVILFGEFSNENMPFEAVVYNFREQDEITHRNVLGTLMAQNIKRETIGDILITPKRAVVFVLKTVLNTCTDITKIGRVGVRVSSNFSSGDIPIQQFEEIKATVQSLRLDAVISSALRLSREKTQELINRKGVMINHVLSFKTDTKICEGDNFSIQGYGKFVLHEIGGFSKKDRIFITIKKYI